MLRSSWWTMALLGLPGIAVAHGATGVAAAQGFPGGTPAIERAAPRDASPPVLDLRVDPTQLPAGQAPVTEPRVGAANAGSSHSGAGPPVVDRGLSFGVELKPRSRVGGLARADEAEDDQLERLMDRATLGLRGRYRF